MDSYKSPRFWLALAGLIAVSVLAGFKIFSSELAAGLLVGLLSGVGVSTPMTGAGLRQAGPVAGAAVVGIGTALLLSMGGCMPAGPEAVLASFWLALTLALGALAAVMVRRMLRWRRMARAEHARGEVARRANDRLRAKLARAGIALGAVLLLFAPGCATTGSIDAKRALQIAKPAHALAALAARTVCLQLPDEEKRAKCLQYANAAAAAGDAALSIAGQATGAD